MFNGKHPWKDPSKLSQTFKTPLLFHKEKTTNNPTLEAAQKKKHIKKKNSNEKNKNGHLYRAQLHFSDLPFGGVSDGSHGVVGTVYSLGTQRDLTDRDVFVG